MNENLQQDFCEVCGSLFSFSPQIVKSKKTADNTAFVNATRNLQQLFLRNLRNLRLRFSVISEAWKKQKNRRLRRFRRLFAAVVMLQCRQ